MLGRPVLDALESDRLILRRRRVDEAGVYRRLWLERDPRVPAHRRIDAEGRPTVELLATRIQEELEEPRPGLLAVVRKSAGDVIGYCGLVFHGNGAPDDPELAFELLRRAHGSGYATEAGATVREWNAASRRVLGKLGFSETGHVEIDTAHGDSLLTMRPTSIPAQ
jgi:ribosomal-protein-alanine N-acetyltransferase